MVFYLEMDSLSSKTLHLWVFEYWDYKLQGILNRLGLSADDMGELFLCSVIIESRT